MGKKAAAKNTIADVTDVEFAMTAQVDIAGAADTDSAMLNSLLSELGDDTEITDDTPIAAAGSDEILVDEIVAEAADAAPVEAHAEHPDDQPADIVGDAPTDTGTAEAPTTLPVDASDEDLEAVLEAAERDAKRQELYAAQEPAVITDAAPPATDPNAPPADAAPAADADAAPEKPKKAAKPKAAPRPTSSTHRPGALLRHKLGEKAGDFLTFSLADGALSPEDLAVKQQQFIDRMDALDEIADKVRDKISMFLVWMAKGGELNEVLKRAITVLHTDGCLTSGDKGNLQLNLLAKPYSMGTARSQANQMFMALPELGLCIKEKGRMVPNPDSALLPMAYAQLGLA